MYDQLWIVISLAVATLLVIISMISNLNVVSSKANDDIDMFEYGDVKHVDPVTDLWDEYRDRLNRRFLKYGDMYLTYEGNMPMLKYRGPTNDINYLWTFNRDGVITNVATGMSLKNARWTALTLDLIHDSGHNSDFEFTIQDGHIKKGDWYVSEQIPRNGQVEMSSGGNAIKFQVT